MTDSEFIVLTNRVFDAIDAALEAAQGADVDWSENDGVFTIECDDGSKRIVNRNVVNREIWVAAKAGGFHYRAERGRWRDTRSDEELGAALARLLRTQGGVALAPLALPATPD